MFQDDELMQEFVVESMSHLAQVEGQLLQIETGGADIDSNLVNTVFRGIHSVKGAAGFLGLSVINALAHSLENVLNMIRNRELVPTPRIVNAMLRASDQLRSLIDDIANSNSADVTSFVEELEAIANETGDDQSVDEQNIDLHVIAEEFTAEPTDSESVLEYSVQDPIMESIEEALMDNLAQVQAAEIVQPPHPPVKPVAASKSAPEKARTNPPATNQDASNTQTKQTRAADSFVRVNVALLDRLMNLAGELVLSRNQLLSAVSLGVKDGLENIASRVDQVTSELQETIMQTRMQPIGTIFSRFPRVVRDLSAKLGKECVLEIEGNEVEVDKTIVEAMGDPLTHLVRNSVDHGIELPEQRTENGKNVVGTIRLRAFHQAGKVCIRIEDDGGGMDPVRLRAKAVEKGLITADQASMMTDGEALRLIFAPGFSTAAQVTDVSGRGVGMDVVRTNIEQLGGTVDIESDLKKGSAIHITLPLTLAIIPSMIIGCAGERYAIPQSSIAELVRVPEAELTTKIGRVKGAEVLRLRGALLPLVRLDSALGLRTAEEIAERPKIANILVLESGQMRYGLLVDTLHDNEEIVVKPLGKHVKELGYLAGATILDKSLPGDLPVPIFIVQHMPPVFTKSLADHLNSSGKIRVSEAVDGEIAANGKVYIAPGGKQMRIENRPLGFQIRVTNDPPVGACKPSVDYLFNSVESCVGGDALAIILTGMGSDGLAGCKRLHNSGARIIAQDADSCVVYGMPRQIIESNLAHEVLTLDAVAARITQILSKQSVLCS